MERSNYINLSVDKDIIAINVSAEEQKMEALLQQILKVLCEKFHLIYWVEDLDLTIQQKHFEKKAFEYNQNDKKRFFVKRLPLLTVSEVTSDDVKFIVKNWNGSFQHTDTILAVSAFSQKLLPDEALKLNPVQYLKDENVLFVVTDGDNPDEYSAFGVYTRKENFPLIYDCIMSGIENIICIDSQ